MNQTLRLLRVIGSPFATATEPPQSSEEILQLYNHALKNKIGLLYLEALNGQRKLGKLSSEYDKQRQEYSEILLTAARASKLLNSMGAEYAVFKSIMPYPGIPNDIDIIFLGSDSKYQEAAEVMLQSGYSHVWDEVPLQVTRHDLRNGEHTDPVNKDVYDLDLYQEIGASHIIYMDKEKLEAFTCPIKLFNEKVKTLTPAADLATMLVHSILPEQTYTLMLYYATLHHIARMNDAEIGVFLNIIKENHITLGAKASIDITAALHNAAHGTVPEKFERILTELAPKTTESKSLVKNDFKTPHTYSISTLALLLLEKMKERKTKRSLMRQAISMLNPRYTKYVITVFIQKHRAETY